MASTSCNELAVELLQHCLAGSRWPTRLLDKILEAGCSDAFFRVVVERLADLFEPRLCDVYADLFTQMMERAMPGANAAELLARYQRVRRARVCRADPDEVFVLSRVTLGADIKVTSMVLDAARKRFPKARVSLVGSAKSAELFAGDPEIGHLRMEYPRAASLPQKLAAGVEVGDRLSSPNAIVIDPDSRLTQLGLLPVCDEANYFFFESRGYGGNGSDDLSALTKLWLRETFEVEAEARIAPVNAGAGDIPKPFATVSLGVGENAVKRVSGTFEAQLLRQVGTQFPVVCIDKGAGGEEARRVDAAIVASGIGDRVRLWEGSFSGFAALIATSKFYVGYDSAGQHAAAALGVPLVSVFSGYVSERMFRRWRPAGGGAIEIVQVSANSDHRKVFHDTLAAMSRIVHSY